MNNLQRGGGPQSAAGKARSSQNAVKHGITSNKMFVLQNENPAAWAEMLDLCVEQFRPATRYEFTIVEEIAFAKWRLRRLWTIENGLMDLEMEEQADAFEKKYDEAPESTRQTLAFKALNEGPGASLLLSRYQVRLERSIERAVKSLRDIRLQPAPLPPAVSVPSCDREGAEPTDKAPKAEARPASEPAAKTEPPQQQMAKRTGPVLVSASTPAKEHAVPVVQNELREARQPAEHLDL